MGKVIKILLSFLSATLLALIILPIACSLLLNLPSVQDYAGRKLTGWLSGKLQTEVHVDKLRLRLFNRVTLDGLYIEDYHQDTMFYARRIVVPLQSLNPFTGRVALGRVELEQPKFYLMQDSTGRTNLKQILLKLKRERKKEKKMFRLTAAGVAISDMAFKHLKLERRDRDYGVNFTDLDVRRFNLRVHDVSVVNDSVNLAIDHISLEERSGLVIDALSTRNFKISGSGMRFERLALRTPDSRVGMNHLYFRTGTWKGYNDFLEKVDISSEIVDSRVSFRTIAFFAPTLRNWQTVFEHVNGTVEGPVAAMSGNLTRVDCRDTRVSVRFGMYGVPDIPRTRFTFDVASLETNEADVAFILGDIAGRTLQPADAERLRRMGRISFTGRFDGLFRDFAASGRLGMDQGNVNLKLNFKSLQARTAGFSGEVRTDGFDLGSLLQVPKLGRFTLAAGVTGSYGGGMLKLKTKADLPRIYYNGYDYHDIELNGEFDNRSFLGAIQSKDENLSFDFDGQLAFNDTVPAYNFALQLYRADLHRLNFNKRDSVSVVRGNLVAVGSGSTLDNMNGEATVSHMVYVNHLDTVRTGNIRFVAQNNAERKQLGMYSSFADVEFRGRLGYKNLFSYFTNTLVTYLPSLDETSRRRRAERPEKPQAATVDNYYLVKVDVKEANNVAGIFLPGLELAEGTKLSFLFNPQSDIFSLTCTSDYIERGNFFVSDLNVSSRNQGDSISLYLRSDDIFVGGVYMPDFSVQGGVKENQIRLATRFNNKENGAYALISTVSTLQSDPLSGIPQLRIHFYPSTFGTDKQIWALGAKEILYDSTRMVVDSFMMVSGKQRLVIDGVASHSMADTLHLRMDNFDLTPLSQITDRQGYRISGFTSGSADMAAALGRGVLYANIAFDDIRVNDIPMRNTVFRSKWDFNAQRALFELADRQQQTPIVQGYYQPSERYYRADVQLDSIDLALLDPALKGAIRDSRGTANAALRLSNPEGRMRLDGRIVVPSFHTTVDYTNVPYTLDSSVIDVRSNVMTMQPTTVRDPQGHSAGFGMSFDFSNLRNLAYDVRVRPEGVLVLNTTLAENDLFYGKVYASGSATISGNKNGVNMNIVASTAGNSQFFLPLSGASNISAADFIVFEDPASKRRTDSLHRMSRRKQILLNRKARLRNTAPSRMNINMQLTLRPDLEMQLVIDPATGDVLKGRGNGSLNLSISPSNDLFTIYGDYDITEGSYKFTLRNIVARTFSLEPGSSIRWTGDPLDATLDITAAYKLKASLSGLMAPGDGAGRSASTSVDCLIKLTDKLTDPTINFDIQLPNATPETQALVSQSINTQEAMATQFLWLLATKSFYSEYQSFGTSLATATGVDFLTNQVSSLMSTERFSLVPKYTPKGELSSDEVGGSVYGELIKDKLILEADVNYDTQNNKASTRQNSVSGDATLSLILDRSGNLRVQAFTRTIEDFNPNQGTQESGIGIFYRENFNSFKDLVQLFKDRFANIARRRAERKAAKRQRKAAEHAVPAVVKTSEGEPAGREETPVRAEGE